MSGWDLIYDNNGYIEIDPDQCGYSSFLGAAVPEASKGEEEDELEQEEEVDKKKDTARRKKQG